MKMKSFVLFIMLIFIMAITAACTNPQQASDSQMANSLTEQNTGQGQQENAYEISLNVYKDYEVLYNDMITTEQSNLFEIINSIDALKIISEDSEGGKFIISIMDLPYCDEQYWVCYINGEELLENISLYEINDGDIVDFCYEAVK